MNGVICLRGRLLSPTRLLTTEGTFEVQEETFYKVNEVYVFQINVYTFPWQIIKAVRVSE